MKHEGIKDEADLQRRVFKWAKSMERWYPELELLHASMNGLYTRDKITARLAVLGGLKNGVPDLFLPVPRNGFHGLYMELKWGSNKPSKKQKWWLSELTKQGYACVLWRDYDHITSGLIEYLEQDKKKR